MSTSSPKIRCAIYTRKSSEEGLDQAFNSLDAQREACQAYIQSQAGEGWRALPEIYDDGGYSGGTLERPALTRLLAAIAVSKIDIVVVYKIDRLTRSLMDFAKIVEQLDAGHASFVSVTQAFNTTTSMGRLTLNVLLSFAQFEREQTGERIRDKIAASKQKGMWMGGLPPLGYDLPTDPTTRALVVNEAEAETVRLICRRYLELRSVAALERWLDARGVRSKAYVSRRGRPMGGARFSRGALFHLLQNRLYLGEISHRDLHYPGRHQPIIDRSLFDAAQAMLADHRIVRSERPTRSDSAPLRGLLFDTDGDPMSPSFGVGRRGKVYRYYVSAPLQQGRAIAGDGDAVRRVPGEALDDLVLDRLRRVLRLPKLADEWTAARKALRRTEVHPTSLHLVLERASLGFPSVDPQHDLETLRRRLNPGEEAQLGQNDPSAIRIVLPIRAQFRGGRTWLTTPDGRSALDRRRVDVVLVNGLRAARTLVRQHDLTGPAAKAPSGNYDRKLCRMGFLAPDIQAAILVGRQPAGLTLDRLVNQPIPASWSMQREELGF